MKQSYDIYNTLNLSSTTYDVIKANGENQSLFANGRLLLNKDGLHLIGGLRYEVADRYGQNGPSDNRTGADVITPTSVSSVQTTWKLGFSQVLSSGADLYAHAATGWRPSAVNYYSDSSNTGTLTVRKESSVTYEAGYRRAADSLYLSAAVFVTKVNDYQETKTNSAGVAGRGYLANVGKVDIPGFEVEIRQAITKSIKLLAGLGFTRARYNSYPEYPTLEGKAPGNRPDWNLNVGAEYTSGAMTSAVTVFGTDSFNSAYTSAGATTQVDGHLIANLRATYAQKNYSVTAFINNVADEEYFLNAGYYNYNSTQPRGQVGFPRTIGVSVKANF
jgi:outer membrane receptor protein involved in Fe transport